MNDHKVNVILYNETTDGFNWPPEGLPYFIAWMQKKLEEVPEEFRDNSYCEIDSESYGYDGITVRLKIGYHRPETDEEIAIRKKEEVDRLEARIQYELRELRNLRAKYPDD